MHGRVKTRSTEEQQAAKKKEREKKLKLYRAGIDRIFTKCRNEEYDEEALEVTAQLLSANPDIYTLWNIRKKALLRLKQAKSGTELQEHLEAELLLTEQCLRGNPKSYGAWYHRVWSLDNVAIPDWSRELALCDKYLQMDERNFHCWDYRRTVVQRASTKPAQELAFSTAKICSNFSNYSAWHYRSKLLPLVHPDPNATRPIEAHKHGEELKLVESAAFTDPNDTSAWFYQRWLLGHADQPLVLTHASMCCSWACVCASRPVQLDGAGHLRVELCVDGTCVLGDWSSSDGQCYSHVWMLQPTSEIQTCGDVVVRLYRGDAEVHTLALSPGEGPTRLVAAHLPQFGTQFGLAVTSVLEEQLVSCDQLLEFEPDSKWTLLTSVLLMQAVDRQRYAQLTMDRLELLLKVDPLRSGYYKDLYSRYKMEYALDAGGGGDALDVSGAGLTAVYHCQYLSTLLRVNLARNLLSRALPQLHPLQCCQVLMLDNNGLQSLENLPPLRSLELLSLKDNAIVDVADLRLAKTRCPRLQTLCVSGNPVAKDRGRMEQFAEDVLVTVEMS